VGADLGLSPKADIRTREIAEMTKSSARLAEQYGCLTIIVAVGVLLWAVSYLFPVRERPQPTKADYRACIAKRIDECIARSADEDLRKSRLDLPVLPTRREREVQCRGVVMETERLFPEAACPKPPQSN
jgi:hypothetical protein